MNKLKIPALDKRTFRNFQHFVIPTKNCCPSREKVIELPSAFLYNVGRITQKKGCFTMAGRPFTIITEVTCDLPQDYLKKHGVVTIPMNYTLDGVEYDGTEENSLPIHIFYEKLRKGLMSKTSAVSPDQATSFFEAELQKGNDVLYLGFSSGLTSGFQSSLLARDELAEKYPEGRVICVDSLCASLGHGLFVDYVVRLAEEGFTLEECAKAAEDIKLKVCHYFTVDDLNHLYRGGRVSKTAAIFGTMLGIKPVMHVDNDGHLIPHGKVRGRRQSLDSLVASMGERLGDDYKNPYVFISHGDCEEDAKYVAAQVKAKYGVKTEIINTIGPIIGTHSGPGTVALFFIGRDRNEKRL